MAEEKKPKTKPKRNPVKGKKQSTVDETSADIQVPTKRKYTKDLSALKYHARYLYVTAINRDVSVSEISRMEKFRPLSERTIRKWAHEGQWTAEREKHRQRVFDTMADKMAREQVRDRLEDYEMLSHLTKAGKSKLLDEDEIPKVKSFESLMTALAKVIGQREDIRERILEQVNPRVPEAVEAEILAQNPIPLPDLSQEEVEAAIEAIFKLRQNRLTGSEMDGANSYDFSDTQ